jgi:hypothetical protein
MASLTDYGWATTAGNYTLVFSGATIGNWVQAHRTKVRRITPVRRRHNFWNANVLLDGKYPAKVWEHEFLLYTEAGSTSVVSHVIFFADMYYGFSDQIGDTAYPLTINQGDTAIVVINFGSCHCEGYDQEDPRDLLLHRAGMVRFRFVGNTKPVVT